MINMHKRAGALKLFFNISNVAFFVLNTGKVVYIHFCPGSLQNDIQNIHWKNKTFN